MDDQTTPVSDSPTPDPALDLTAESITDALSMTEERSTVNVQMVEPTVAAVPSPTDDMRTCVVCGRVFNARVPGERCESRPETDSACCPHPYCNSRSPFVSRSSGE